MDSYPSSFANSIIRAEESNTIFNDHFLGDHSKSGAKLNFAKNMPSFL